MAISNRLQTNHFLLDEFKTYKNMDLADTSNDTMISLILYSIEDFLKSQFGIYLNQESVKKTFSVKNGMVILPSYTIDLISATLDGESIDVSNLYMEGNIILGKTDGILTDGIDNIELEYTIGFGFENIPFNVKNAVFWMVDILYEKVLNNENTTSSFNDPVGGRAVILKSIPKEVYQLLNPYIVYNF